MAGVQSVYPQIPPPYAHSSQMNGSFSQVPLGSFDGQSIHSTPAPTPPPPRPGSQQQMNYGMNGGHAQNGMMPPNNYSGYPDPTLYNQPQYYGNDDKPEIYTVRLTDIAVILPNLYRRCIQMSTFSRWKSTVFLSCDVELIHGSMQLKY